ncbi:MAG TPA: hypothetical protein PL173_13035 [Saprospiraceae bacterium]|nr:hypothetical protein [Saprospiraceae bacterium]HNI55787.1 hypothetical protein [Chitinophagales bacterium]
MFATDNPGAVRRETMKKTGCLLIKYDTLQSTRGTLYVAPYTKENGVYFHIDFVRLTVSDSLLCVWGSRNGIEPYDNEMGRLIRVFSLCEYDFGEVKNDLRIEKYKANGYSNTNTDDRAEP